MIGIILICLLLIISGISKSIMDVLQFKFNISIFSKFKNQNYWNPSISWMNKYKNNDPTLGPKFFGSTTFLIWSTDAWHFFQMIMLSCLQLIPIIVLTLFLNFLGVEIIRIVLIDIGCFIIIKIMFGSVFELFFKKILIKK